MPVRIGLVTCLKLPEPDPDREPLCLAVEKRGVAAEWVAWDDASVDWGAYALLVLRSTWNYYRQADAFLAWVDAVSTRTRLLNPARVVRWNVHKGYLLELATRGVPVAPTELVRRGEGTRLVEICSARGWSDVVIKPAISAASFSTMRARQGELDGGEQFLAAAVQGRDMLVQPYLASVEGPGERSLVFIAGELSHAVRKSPRFAGGHEKATKAPAIHDDEKRVAALALAAVPEELLYARVDLARDGSGNSVVMELELIEPSLFLREHPPALERLATHIVERAGV